MSKISISFIYGFFEVFKNNSLSCKFAYNCLLFVSLIPFIKKVVQ